MICYFFQFHFALRLSTASTNSVWCVFGHFNHWDYELYEVRDGIYLAFTHLYIVQSADHDVTAAYCVAGTTKRRHFASCVGKSLFDFACSMRIVPFPFSVSI
ncbi:hypothetical protein TRVL_08550 [Trypanosoma vivax]|nr:hypothetical protein TRVL_08550 [Trypanosoma vivax]